MKLGEWTVFLITMIIFMEMLGVTTGLGLMLQTVGIGVEDGTVTGGDLEGSNIWALVLAALAVISAGGAIAIGFFARSYDTSLVIAPLIVSVLLLFGSTFFSIMSIPALVSTPWIKNIIGILFIGMGGSFLWSGVNYFAGR